MASDREGAQLASLHAHQLDDDPDRNASSARLAFRGAAREAVAQELYEKTLVSLSTLKIAPSAKEGFFRLQICRPSLLLEPAMAETSAPSPAQRVSTRLSAGGPIALLVRHLAPAKCIERRK